MIFRKTFPGQNPNQKTMPVLKLVSRTKSGPLRSVKNHSILVCKFIHRLGKLEIDLAEPTRAMR